MLDVRDHPNGACPACGTPSVRVEQDSHIECVGCRRVNHV